jgi:metal-responsive CopG/Arc/MetJ family transcriptional regulator
MKRDPEDGYETVEVELPTTLVADLDTFTVSNGYRSVDAVVAEAIEQHAQ